LFDVIGFFRRHNIVLANTADAAMVDALVRLEGAAGRAEAKLAKFVVVIKPPSLATYLAARQGDGVADTGTPPPE
jgi:hypothetical protein